jgi:CubicO group peptidase (beta-lactamase class C family)
MRLKSVTKISTAALIQKLAQAGKLRLGDTVDSWLPGLLPCYGVWRGQFGADRAVHDTLASHYCSA